MSLALETAPTRLAFLLGTLWFLCAATLDHAAEPARRQIALRDGWLVKQLDTDKPDVAALVRESASPDKTWLSARMPAQVHDVLLAHGLIRRSARGHERRRLGVGGREGLGLRLPLSDSGEDPPVRRFSASRDSTRWPTPT